jgi:hypothetical protein
MRIFKVLSITNVQVILLPLPLIWKVRLPRSTKLSLSALFLLGFVVVAATILSAVEGARSDFISSANFCLFCNLAITAAAGVACLPQIRMLFLKRFRKEKSPSDPSSAIGVTMREASLSTPQTNNGTMSQEKKCKSTPLILSNKFLSGDGKVGIGNARLSEKRGSADEDVVELN